MNLILDELIKQTFTVGELNDIVPSLGASASITAPTLVLVGDHDFIACFEPSCTETGSLVNEAAAYPSAQSVDVQILPNTGHSMNLHLRAPHAFEAIDQWITDRL